MSSRCLATDAVGRRLVGKDAKRGEIYLRLEFEDKVARHDTEILSVVEDGDAIDGAEMHEQARVRLIRGR